MKKYLKTICFCIALSIFFSCSSTKAITKSKVQKIEVATAFKRVYDATQQALAEADNKTLKLESIDLSFATTTTFSVEAGVKLWVLSGKHSRKSSASKKATFTFEEDTDAKKALAEDPQIEQFKKYLTVHKNKVSKQVLSLRSQYQDRKSVV